MQVTSVVPLRAGASGDEVVRLAAAAEAATRHPLAEAVLREAEGRGLSIPPAQDPRTEAGSGVMAIVEGSLVAVGKRDWVERICWSSQHLPSSDAAHNLSEDLDRSAAGSTGREGPAGSSSAWVGVEGRGLIGVLGLKDVLRPDARLAVSRLRDMGIR